MLPLAPLRPDVLSLRTEHETENFDAQRPSIVKKGGNRKYSANLWTPMAPDGDRLTPA